MLEFIVLGKIPGTQVQVDFMLLLMSAAIFVSALLLLLVMSRAWHRLIDAARSILMLKNIAL
jgi:hypothetical protein